MRLIVNGFDHKDQITIVENLNNDLNVEAIIHIIDSNTDSNIISNNKIHHLVVSEIIHGNYPINEQLLPLDSDIIEKMIPFEPMIMRQMDRFETYLKYRISYDNRKEIYYKHLRYWNHIIKKLNIDLYIGANIPHDIYDYTIYGLCKIYNIKTLFFYQSQIKDIIHPMENWTEFTSTIPMAFEEILKKYNDTHIENILLSKQSQIEWDALHQDNVPFYMHKEKFSIFSFFYKSFRLLLRYIKGLNSYRGLVRKVQNYYLNKEYNKLTSDVDFSKNYFYYPLHYQPELTSCPLGGPFVDQYLIIQLIESLLPADYYLFVKEHPKQEFASRHFKYYRNLIENSLKIKLIPKSTSSFDLIRGSKAVVTISGTAGWESIFRNKPVLLFGHNFYQHAPGVYKIKTIQDCKNAIEEIIDNKSIIDRKSLKLFLKIIEENSIKGFSDMAYSKVSNYSLEESRDNIYKYIHDYIENIV